MTISFDYAALQRVINSDAKNGISILSKFAELVDYTATTRDSNFFMKLVTFLNMSKGKENSRVHTAMRDALKNLMNARVGRFGLAWKITTSKKDGMKLKITGAVDEPAHEAWEIVTGAVASGRDYRDRLLWEAIKAFFPADDKPKTISEADYAGKVADYVAERGGNLALVIAALQTLVKAQRAVDNSADVVEMRDVA